MKHYIYYHIDPRTNQVKYVGKGSAYRAYEINYRRSLKHLEWIREITNIGLAVKIEIVERFEFEKDAYKREKELIAKFREDGVFLLNTLPGGDPLCGQNNPMYGRKRPDIAIRNIENKGKTYEDLYGLIKAKEIGIKLSRPGKLNGAFGKKREDLAERNRLQKGKTAEDIHGPEKANKIREKLGGTKILRNDGIVFYSIKSAAKAINTTRYLLQRHLNGFSLIIKGFTFQYIDQAIDN
jgi:hypothetical protein